MDTSPPRLPFLKGLRELYPEVAFRYVGKKGKVEEGMVPKEWAAYGAKEKEVQFVSTTSGSLKSPKVLFQLGLGLRSSSSVSTGQFVRMQSLQQEGMFLHPLFLLLGTKKIGLLKTKIMLHEANAELGRMNAAAVKMADKVAVSFPGTKVTVQSQEDVRWLPRSKTFGCRYIRREIYIEA